MSRAVEMFCFLHKLSVLQPTRFLVLRQQPPGKRPDAPVLQRPALSRKGRRLEGVADEGVRALITYTDNS